MKINLKGLLKKIEKLNNLNKDLEINYKYYLVVYNRYMKNIYLYSSKDLKDLCNYYIDDISSKLINDNLIKEERYSYVMYINNEKYEMNLGVDKQC